MHHRIIKRPEKCAVDKIYQTKCAVGHICDTILMSSLSD